MSGLKVNSINSRACSKLIVYLILFPKFSRVNLNQFSVSWWVGNKMSSVYILLHETSENGVAAHGRSI